MRIGILYRRVKILYQNRFGQGAQELRDFFPRFAEQARIPVAETQAGKSSMPWDHPLAMGAVGVTGTLASNNI